MQLTTLRRASALAAATSVAMLGLSACATGSSDEGGSAPAANSSADADAFPVTIESTYGEATIEEVPERVVTLGVDGDNAAALGVAPIAVQKMTWGGNAAGTTDWFDDALAEIDGAEAPELLDITDAVPTDDIIGLEPDVVIATNSGLTQDDFDKLTAAGIPVVAHPGIQWGTTWEQSMEMTGQALGRSAAADEIIAETKETLETTAEENPAIVGASFIWTFIDPTDVSSIGVYTTADNRPAILEELGMVSPPIVEEAGEDSFFFNVSAERAADLDADVLISYGTSAEEAEELVQTPVVQQIPPIADGSYVISLEPNDTLGLSFPSVLGMTYALDHFVPELAAAIGGEPQVF